MKAEWTKPGTPKVSAAAVNRAIPEAQRQAWAKRAEDDGRLKEAIAVIQKNMRLKRVETALEKAGLPEAFIEALNTVAVMGDAIRRARLF